MIVVDARKIRFLRNGRTILVPNDGKHRIGRHYKLRIAGQHKASSLEVRILAIEDTQLRIQLSTRDQPRLLAAKSQYGYTDDPAKAMWGEPEAVSQDEQERITQAAVERWQQDPAFAKQRGRSISIELKHASRLGDLQTYAALGSELLQLAGTAGTAVAA